MTDDVEPDVSPTAELVLEVLIARHRLGEPFWPFTTRVSRALDELASRGWVAHWDGPIPRTRNAKLTTVGRDRWLTPGYRPSGAPMPDDRSAVHGWVSAVAASPHRSLPVVDVTFWVDPGEARVTVGDWWTLIPPLEAAP